LRSLSAFLWLKCQTLQAIISLNLTSEGIHPTESTFGEKHHFIFILTPEVHSFEKISGERLLVNFLFQIPWSLQTG
jgi:hypothetical protein